MNQGPLKAVGSKTGAEAPLFALPPDDFVGEAERPPAVPPTASTPLPTSAVTEPGDHRTALVQALTEGAARALAAGDTRAALLALETLRTLVGDAAPSATLVGAERKKRGAP